MAWRGWEIPVTRVIRSSLTIGRLVALEFIAYIIIFDKNPFVFTATAKGLHSFQIQMMNQVIMIDSLFNYLLCKLTATKGQVALAFL